jgi:hypothetical protein
LIDPAPGQLKAIGNRAKNARDKRHFHSTTFVVEIESQVPGDEFTRARNDNQIVVLQF